MKHLTDFERGQILAYATQGKSFREIAKILTRDKNTISKYLKPSILSSNKKQGRKRKLSLRTERKIYKIAQKEAISASEIKDRLQLNVSKHTVIRTLHRSEKFDYIKMKPKPKLGPNHVAKRFEFALEHMYWTSEWENVIFSDEKKFNLDGPDGNKYYWHHVDTDVISYSNRVQGGGGHMVWIGFCASGKLVIQFVDKKMNSKKYVEMLKISLKPFIENLSSSDNITFQQDNAPCHRAKNTREWLTRNNINFMEWPALSPDLNPVENIWAEMSRHIYKNGKQYDDALELKSAILCAWAIISEEFLKSLILSMKTRMRLVLEQKGGSIRY